MKKSSIRLLTRPLQLALLASAFLPVTSHAFYYSFFGPGNASTSGSDIFYQETRYPYWTETTYAARLTTWVDGYTAGGSYDGTYTYSGPSYSTAPNTTGGSYNTYIQSFWPTPNNHLLVVPEWWLDSCFADQPMIGEGASGKVSGVLPMQSGSTEPGVWYANIFRIWQSSDPNQTGVSKMGQWCKDGVTGKWSHIATFNIPFVASQGMATTGGFLEDMDNGGRNPRRGDFRNAYYHLSGQWNAAVTFAPEIDSSVEKGSSGLIDNNTVGYFETCDNASYTGNMGPGPAGQVYYYTLNTPPASTGTPTVGTRIAPCFDLPQVTAVSASVASGQLSVNWSVPATGSPQFSYTIDVFGSPDTSGTPVQSVTEISPDACAKIIATSVTSPTVRLRMTDVFGQPAAPVIVTASPVPALPPVSGLLTMDIGAVGTAGNDVALSNGACTITGGAGDVWNSADACRFAYRPMTGDGQITARVLTQDATYPSAQAGVMIRNDLTPGSMQASMFMTPVNGLAFQYRTATGAGSGSSAFSSGTLPDVWVRVVRSGSTFTGYTSADGVTWTAVNSQTIPMGTTVYVGLSVSSHSPYYWQAGSATFSNVMCSVSAPWASGDIGNVGLAGDAESNNLPSGSVFKVTGGGQYIWGGLDAFHFVYQPVTGDCSITTQVLSQHGANSNSQAGVMIRGDLTADGAYAAIFMTPAHGLNSQCRLLSGGNANSVTAPNTPDGAYCVPYTWLRVVRSGKTFTTYSSPDGVNWTTVDTQTITMGTTVYVGMAVSADDNTLLSDATFGSVSGTGLQ